MMKTIYGMVALAVTLAHGAAGQAVIAPVACELMNERPDSASAGPYLENDPPVGWWDSAGIISDAALIADGASVPAVWPQHEYGYKSTTAPRIRDVNEDTLTPNGTVVLTFDLGGIANVDGIVLWNHGEGVTTQSDRGIETAAISYSTDGVNFTDSGEILTFAKGPQDSDTVTLTPIDADPQYLAAGLSEVTHIRMTCLNFNLGVIAGFAEIRMIGDRPYAPKFIADPVVKANAQYGSDYAIVSQTLAGSATNAPGDAVTYEKVGGPDWLVVASDGALSGIPDMTSTNVFSIKAIVGDESAEGTLQIIVDALGNVPVFTADPVLKADGVFNGEYSDLLQTLDGSATDADPTDILTYSRTGGPAWLNVASNGALSGVCNVLGTNTFSIAVDDGNGNSDTASLVIFVPTIGNPPVFTTDVIVKSDVAFGGDYALYTQTLAGSATDVDGDTLIYSKTDGAAWLNVASNGVLSGVSTLAGTNSFTVKVDDGNGNIDTATLLIYVMPLPVGDLILGIDTFDSATAPSVTYTAAGVAATVTTSASVDDWSIADGSGRGSSKDGTWGTHEGPPVASPITDIARANLTLTNAKTDGEITLTITNSGTEDLALGAFHFDALAFRPKAPRTYALNVLPGSSITEGNVFTSAEEAITSLGGALKTDDADPETHDQHDDIDIALDGLADSVLEAGGVVILQIAFSGGAGDNSGGHHLFIDNIGLSLKGVSAPVIPNPPVMNVAPSGSDMTISWVSPAAFKVQTRASLAFGDWVDYPGGTTSPVIVVTTNDVEFLRLIQQ